MLLINSNQIVKKMLQLFVTLMFFLSFPVIADNIVVIINKDNNQSVTKEFLTKVYLGKVSTWPDGSHVMAFDQAEDNPVHDKFYIEILGKNPSLVKSLWTQNIFTGKRLPPKIANPDIEMKKLVNINKNAIGYINASNIDESVKVIAITSN